MKDGEPDLEARIDPPFRSLGFTGPISGGRHQFMKKGTLKVRIPNPHKSDTIDGSLVKEILRQASIRSDQWDDA